MKQLHDFISVQVTKREFWARWMQFLSAETFSFEEQLNDKQSANSRLDFGESHSIASEILKLDGADVGCYEALHARYAPSRRLKNLFFEEHILVRLQK